MALRALIIDPNPLTRAFLRRVLGESLLDAVAYEEYAQATLALAQCQHTAPYDLALIDLDGADPTSLALLDWLRLQPTLKVGHTLYADEEALFAAVQHGIDGYLLKEDRMECAVEALQRIVRGRPTLPPSLARRMLIASKESTSVRSARELELLDFTAKGFTPKEISNLMGLSLTAVGQLTRGLYRCPPSAPTAAPLAPPA